MAAGRNDLRYLNVLHRTCTSLSLNTLLCFFTLLWRGCEESSMILISFCNILLWMMTSSGSRATPRTEPAFFQFVDSVQVSGSDAAAPADGCKADCTLHNRLIEDVQHFGADIKRSQLP